MVDKKELAKLFSLHSIPEKQFSEEDISDQMLDHFNKEYAVFLNKYPDYDIWATGDYVGKPDDEFVDIIMDTAEKGNVVIVENEEGGYTHYRKAPKHFILDEAIRIIDAYLSNKMSKEKAIKELEEYHSYFKDKGGMAFGRPVKDIAKEYAQAIEYVETGTVSGVEDRMLQINEERVLKLGSMEVGYEIVKEVMERLQNEEQKVNDEQELKELLEDVEVNAEGHISYASEMNEYIMEKLSKMLGGADPSRIEGTIQEVIDSYDLSDIVNVLENSDAKKINDKINELLAKVYKDKKLKDKAPVIENLLTPHIDLDKSTNEKVVIKESNISEVSKIISSFSKKMGISMQESSDKVNKQEGSKKDPKKPPKSPQRIKQQKDPNMKFKKPVDLAEGDKVEIKRGDSILEGVMDKMYKGGADIKTDDGEVKRLDWNPNIAERAKVNERNVIVHMGKVYEVEDFQDRISAGNISAKINETAIPTTYEVSKDELEKAKETLEEHGVEYEVKEDGIEVEDFSYLEDEAQKEIKDVLSEDSSEGKQGPEDELEEKILKDMGMNPNSGITQEELYKEDSGVEEKKIDGKYVLVRVNDDGTVSYTMDMPEGKAYEDHLESRADQMEYILKNSDLYNKKQLDAMSDEEIKDTYLGVEASINEDHLESRANQSDQDMLKYAEENDLPTSTIMVMGEEIPTILTDSADEANQIILDSEKEGIDLGIIEENNEGIHVAAVGGKLSTLHENGDIDELYDMLEVSLNTQDWEEKEEKYLTDLLNKKDREEISDKEFESSAKSFMSDYENVFEVNEAKFKKMTDFDKSALGGAPEDAMVDGSSSKDFTFVWSEDNSSLDIIGETAAGNIAQAKIDVSGANDEPGVSYIVDQIVDKVTTWEELKMFLGRQGAYDWDIVTEAKLEPVKQNDGWLRQHIGTALVDKTSSDELTFIWTEVDNELIIANEDIPESITIDTSGMQKSDIESVIDNISKNANNLSDVAEFLNNKNNYDWDIVTEAVNEEKFSLINVSKEENGKVSGSWIQDHVGTLDSAIKAAKETEEANDNKIDVAVVPQVSGSGPNMEPVSGLERLDEKDEFDSYNKELLSYAEKNDLPTGKWEDMGMKWNTIVADSDDEANNIISKAKDEGYDFGVIGEEDGKVHIANNLAESIKEGLDATIEGYVVTDKEAIKVIKKAMKEQKVKMKHNSPEAFQKYKELNKEIKSNNLLVIPHSLWSSKAFRNVIEMGYDINVLLKNMYESGDQNPYKIGKHDLIDGETYTTKDGEEVTFMGYDDARELEGRNYLIEGPDGTVVGYTRDEVEALLENAKRKTNESLDIVILTDMGNEADLASIDPGTKVMHKGQYKEISSVDKHGVYLSTGERIPLDRAHDSIVITEDSKEESVKLPLFENFIKDKRR